jgi:hypothetical protein
MSVPSVSVIVAMPCLSAAFAHFLQPLRKNQARATLADCWPHRVVPLPDFKDRCVEVPPAVLTTMTSCVRFQFGRRPHWRGCSAHCCGWSLVLRVQTWGHPTRVSHVLLGPTPEAPLARPLPHPDSPLTESQRHRAVKLIWLRLPARRGSTADRHIPLILPRHKVRH